MYAPKHMEWNKIYFADFAVNIMTSYQAFCLYTINREKKNYEEARKIPIFLSTVHCSDIWEAKKAEFSTFSTNIMMEKYDQAHAIS